MGEHNANHARVSSLSTALGVSLNRRIASNRHGWRAVCVEGGCVHVGLDIDLNMCVWIGRIREDGPILWFQNPTRRQLHTITQSRVYIRKLSGSRRQECRPGIHGNADFPSEAQQQEAGHERSSETHDSTGTKKGRDLQKQYPFSEIKDVGMKSIAQRVAQCHDRLSLIYGRAAVKHSSKLEARLGILSQGIFRNEIRHGHGTRVSLHPCYPLPCPCFTV